MTPPKKKKGAPKGNRNALKHGIYTKFIAVIDDKQLAKMSAVHTADELALARVKLKNALTNEIQSEDDESRLKWNAAAQHWMDVIVNMIVRNKETRETEVMVFTTILDAIRYANDKQGIK
jgi:hypothetical protein